VIDLARAWLAEHRWAQIGLLALGAVIVVGLVAGGGVAWYRAREAQGAAALGDALAQAQRAEAASASAEERGRAIKALEAVISEHSGLSALPQAAYMLGNLRYANGQHAAARGAYELALARGASGTVRTLASTGIGYSWEAEKNYPNAVQAYERALKGLGPRDFFYEDAVVSLARAQDLAGKPAAALELYERALKDVPDSRRAGELRARIADLRSRTKS
jgi:tetratricopeptide (TPR) repeat protein